MNSAWLQLDSSRVKMLNAFDEAKARTLSHEVKTFHGNVAEAKFREWLAGFLPMRFGVTSGYILSKHQFERGFTVKGKLPHYDVIIYDRTESPVLWIDDNPDLSDQGKSKAILSNHVKAIIEVKASVTRESVKKVACQIARINNIYKITKPNRIIPDSFFSMAVFFEVDETGNSKSILANLVPNELQHFAGGCIFRTTEQSREVSVYINPPLTNEYKLEIDNQYFSHLVALKPINNQYAIGLSDGKQINNKWYYMSFTSTPNEFANFAFNLIARLNGTYSPVDYRLVDGTFTKSFL